MKIAVFASGKTTKDGRKYTAFIAKLTSQTTGETRRVRVKFTEEAGEPKASECPMYINVEKKNANMVERRYTDEASQEERISYRLWVKSWEKDKEPYIDHSLDDFE